MREILGNNLAVFFTNAVIDANQAYKGEEYEVWELTDTDYEKICDMSEEEFLDYASDDDAWWRGAEGSNMGSPDVEYVINGEKMLAWDGNSREDYVSECENCSDRESGVCEGTKADFDDCFGAREYSKLTEYLCEEIGASQPRNVCALAVDLARYNRVTMGELFTKYEG